MLDELGPVFGASYRDINWHALTRGAQRIFYFDALPRQKSDETEEAFEKKLNEKQEKFSFLKRVPGLHVREGLTRLRENSRRPQQKGVDVALAVEVLKHAHRENMGAARLFLNDLDFLPLLEALTDTKVLSELVYFPRKTSTDLIEAADRSEVFDVQLLWNSLNHPLKKKFSLESWQSDKTESASPVATGNNKYGPVEIFFINEAKQYGVGGLIGSETYLVASNCLELVVCHFDACAQCTTEWDGGWSPVSERGKRWPPSN